jgi:hypothetical protein
MTLRRVARPRLLDSHCLPENSRGCLREIALFPILLFFRFAFRFGHVESCHRSTLREILKFKLTNYTISCPSEGEARKRLQGGNFCRILRHLGSGIDARNVTSVLPLFEIARVLVRFNHVACFIVNATHGIIYTSAGQTQRTKTSLRGWAARTKSTALILTAFSSTLVSFFSRMNPDCDCSQLVFLFSRPFLVDDWQR